MKRIFILLLLLFISLPVLAHYDESSIELYDVSEYEAKYEQLRKEYDYKIKNNLPCGSYDSEVITKLHIWLIEEQRQGRQLQGVNPVLREYINATDIIKKR